MMEESMEYVKMNKQKYGAYRAYERSSTYSLWDAYDKPSCYKERAWEEIEEFCREIGGRGLKMIGWNCCMFSCGFIKDGYFYYFTHVNNFKIYVGE